MNALAAISLAAVRIALIGEIPSQTEGRGFSGLAWRGDDAYWAVDDRDGKLYPLTIPVDRETGRARRCEVGPPVALAGRKDLESVVWDPARACVWASDESDGSVRAFSPATGNLLDTLALPPCYSAFRPNYAIEATALCPDGRTFWVCNEDALSRRQAAHGKGPPVEDGPLATRTRGSLVRLQRFTRPSAWAPWTPAGQHGYETDALAGRSVLNRGRCGVVELCCLDGGVLLALEREFSVKAIRPAFRCRIYAIDLQGATDTSCVPSLASAAVRTVGKRLLFEADTGLAMYEAMCPGPTLADGTRVLVLISDAGEGSAARIMTLRLWRKGT
ncbi:MAG: esterase-like activity of phytase family protein [Kiritimatiellia bacterium]